MAALKMDRARQAGERPHHLDVVAVALAGLDTSSANSSPSCRLSW